MTTISIIGTGNVGSALGRVFARSQVDAMIANTRGPDSFPELAAIIVDATNSFYLPNEDEVLAGRLSTEIVTDASPGAEVVKAFNQLPANILPRQLSAAEGKIVIFIASSSDSEAKKYL
jgi:predicted dinucleotide-binding enzyme